MKKRNCIILTSLLLSVIIFSVNSISVSAAVFKETVRSEVVFQAKTEQKQICTATIDAEFADDSVLVMFNNDTSLNLDEYDKYDFTSINAQSVKDITKYKKSSIKNDINNKFSDLSVASARSIDDTTLREIKQERDVYLKNNYSDYHQIVEIKLKDTGKQNVLDAIRELEKRDDVLVAEPNYIMHLDSSTVVPNDTRYSEQWAINKIDLPLAWNLTTGSSTVDVGILDTGIKADHPDLADNIDQTLSKSFIDDYPFVDEYGHGTHVAGIVGAIGNNNTGIAGTCWDVNLISLKITKNGSNEILVGNLVNAINYAQENDIEILNLSASLAGNKDYQNNHSALKEALDNFEGLFICSAGNQLINVDGALNESEGSFSTWKIYPSTYTNENIMTVAATTNNDILWTFNGQQGSNYGPVSIDLAAPGDEICSTFIGETDDSYYKSWSGTSMAAPYVTGVAALIKSKYPGISPYGIKKAILDSVDIVPALNGKVKTSGRLNAYQALLAVEDCQYTVAYNKNGGSGTTMSNTTVTYGITTRLSANTYTPQNGKKFIGWYAHRQSDNKWYYEGANGTGWYTEGSQPSGYTKHLYNDQARVAHTSSVDNDLITMYAQWGTSEYYISFNPNGGGGTNLAQQRLTYDKAEALSGNLYTKAGYYFAGWVAKRDTDNKWYYTNGTQNAWYTENQQPSGYSKYVFEDKAVVLNLSGVHNDVVRMYATWNPNEYTIYFDSNGGTGTMNPITGYSDIDVNLGTNAFTKTNYLFKGWHIVDDEGYWCVDDDGYEDWSDDLTGYEKKLFGNNDVVNYVSDAGVNLTAYVQWVSKDSVLIGDVNLDGVVSVLDATDIQKYLVGNCEFNDIQLYAADVNGDGIISILDVNEIQELL